MVFQKGNMPPNHGKKYPAESLTELEVEALIRGASRRAPTGLRNRALVELVFRAGLRIEEALALKVADIDLEARTVRVLQGKGSKARTVALLPCAWGNLDAWLEKRTALGFNGHHRLFCTLQGGPISQAYVRGALRRMAKRAGIEKRVHPHGLRHSYAVYCHRNGAGVFDLKQSLGHSSLATTEKYLASLFPVETIERMHELPEIGAGK
jgi:site-specific recombinase XerD